LDAGEEAHDPTNHKNRIDTVGHIFASQDAHVVFYSTILFGVWLMRTMVGWVPPR
jgi:hypothetical protein